MTTEADLAAAREELTDAIMARDFAIAGTEGLQGLLQQAQAREARVRHLLGWARRVVHTHQPNRPGDVRSLYRLMLREIDEALAESGDNPVWEVVEAARRDIANAKTQCGGDGQGCEAFRPSYKPPRVWAKCGRCPMGALFETGEALARLDGNAEEKG